ncbi:rod shape-determining protein [Anaeromicropila populeti]|uniref:Cell shape-determining protein MreB n=1 Tax=Anaeromicropila populeti TaxID=37658 RepID=A0A1I6L7X2_9FIRM|nr:rod shape-determining protein [Anaeromicropila populeti]SFR99527.1 rod shape-determining protein MreB [Anaeromicropila populeti]
MARRMFGIDFGTSMIKIYKKGEGLVLDEKNVIATQKKKFYAGGNEAYDMLEKAPENIMVSYPMKNGVIAEIANMQMLLDYFLKKAFGKKGGSGSSDFLIAVPTNITEVERRAFVDLVKNSVGKAKDVKLIEKPITAALGIGLDVATARGVMTVDIGADTTEIAIMSISGIVLTKLIPIGGNKLDESIQLAVKKHYNLYIGGKTSEIIKKELASAMGSKDNAIRIYGRDVVTGLPKETLINAELVNESINEHLHTIVDSIKMILERTPPEISSDIIDAGIYITGGSAKISGLEKLIAAETELEVNVSDDCENSVVNGLGVIIEEAASKKQIQF